MKQNGNTRKLQLFSLLLLQLAIGYYTLFHFVHFFGITLGLQPVGVQCPITSSLCEFPGYWDWLRYPGLPPVLVSIAFSLCLPYLGVFPFTLHLPLDFISVSSLLPTYLQSAPIEITSLTHFLSEFPDLGLALVHDVVVQEAEQRCA